MRKGSPTYKKWISVELSESNYRQLIIPRGFLHGFVTLTDHVEFVYKVDNYYDAIADRSIIWNDPDLNVDWGLEDPILSSKDVLAPRLCDSDIDYVYGESV
jgi:dTDP-4-dehydrorhamnose 3,5-epimerase